MYKRFFALIALGMLVATLFVPLFMAEHKREDMAIGFAIVAGFLAFSFGLLSWSELIGKTVTLMILLLVLVCGAFSMIWSIQMKAREAEAEALTSGAESRMQEAYEAVRVREELCGDIRNSAKAGDVGKVAALLDKHPELINAKEKETGATPLHLAAENGRKDAVKTLLADKADVNIRDHNGLTPLHVAAEKGHKDVVELLLANNADADAKVGKGPLAGKTACQLAVENGHQDIADLLSRRGPKT